MKKSDLKDGMIVETGEDLYLVCGDKFLSLNGYMQFKDYDENLKIKDEGFEKYNINFVYKTECWGLGLKDLLSKTTALKDLLSKTTALKLIWERKKEIDWSKVPFGTKVITSDCSDFEGALENEYIFVGYKEDLKRYPFIVALNLDKGATSFRYCKIHPLVKIKEEWYKE
ncbi:hypothetical protein P5F14_15310 [Clostridium perfringens]|nr:hypothetical protein [Clostridium perfringens]